jgi:hypothetical protein
MKNLKFGVLAFAALGLLGCFLAFAPGPEGNVSWFDLRDEQGFGSRVLVLVAGFAAALVAGGLSLALGMKRWIGIVAALGFIATWVAIEFNVADLFGLMVGAKLMAIGAIGGLVSGIACAIAPEQPRAALPASPQAA